jgi:hypothetical protein
MFKYNSLITYLLTLCVGLFMTACPDDECGTDEAGAMAGAEEMTAGAAEECEEEGGNVGGDNAGSETAGGDTAGAPGDSAGDSAGDAVTTYGKVVVLDTTTDINADGTPGVDICEILVECDGAELDGGEFVQDPGESPTCDGSNDANCLCVDAVEGICGGTDRTDGSFAFDGDASCEGDNWVSIGINGAIVYENSGLEMCAAIDVSVTERGGPQTETYITALCSSDLSVNDIDVSNMLFGDSCVELGRGGEGTQAFSWAAP